MESVWLIALKLLAIALLVGANGLFVAAEFALVSLRPTKLRPSIERGDRLSILVHEAQKNLNYYLSSCQVGITIASLGLGWIGEPALADTLIGLFSGLPGPWDLLASHAVAFTIAFSIIVLLHVALGELVPKALAIFKPEPVARLVIVPLIIFTRVGSPVIWLLNELANAFVRMFGLTLPEEVEIAHSPEEIELLLRQSRRHGMLSHQPMKIIEKVFDLPRRSVKEVMTPRPEVASIEEDSTLSDLIDLFTTSAHLRFPVYRERPENVIGYVAMRNALEAIKDDPNGHDKPISDVIQPILYVPEKMTVSTLFAQMQQDRIPMVAVVNEFSDTVGMVTLDGLAEEILGYLGEADVEPYYERLDGRKVRIDAQVRIEEANEALMMELPEREEYQTLAGFALYQLKRVPQPGESLRYERWRLIVDKMNGPRIETLIIERL